MRSCHSVKTVAAIARPSLSLDEVRVADEDKVAVDDVEEPVHDDVPDEEAGRVRLRGVSVVPRELSVALVEQGLHVVETAGEGVDAPLHEVLVHERGVLVSHEVRAQGVSKLGLAESDLAVADGLDHKREGNGLPDDVDGAKDPSEECEVPVGPDVAKLLLLPIVHKKAKEGGTRAANSNEGDPVLDAQRRPKHVEEGAEQHEECVSVGSPFEVD